MLSRCGLEKHALLVLLATFPVAPGRVAAAAPPTHPYGQTESFNLLNRPNFDLANREFGTPTFGQIFSANDSRELQFALKFHF